MTRKTSDTSSASFKPCVVIPVYNHPDQLETLIAAVASYGLNTVLVDDGSESDCRRVINQLNQQYEHVALVTHSSNQGKGAAIKTGLKTALCKGFSHVLQIDADGQHNAADIPRFIERAKASPDALIVGYPEFDDSIPRHRYYGRYLSHIWVWINTLSTTIRDSMCGFRVYPLERSCQLLKQQTMGNRMDFDGEFIVRWFWRYRQLEQLATRVTYPEQNTSHFQPFNDNKLISWMHARLFVGMLRRFPRLLLARRSQ